MTDPLLPSIDTKKCRTSFPHNNIFFQLQRKRTLRSKKNKKNLNRNAWNYFITPPRIISLLAAGIMVFFFTTAIAEQIICPETSPTEAKSLLDEYYFARAYDKGYCGFAIDKKTAQEWYIKAAEHGHRLAQYYLAEIYLKGENSPSNYQKAKEWYLAAAKQDHGASQLQLAILSMAGNYIDIRPDYAAAEKWLLKAAEKNIGDARFRLGDFYHNYKKPPHHKKAVLWLTRAAEGGNRAAMFDLALMLKKGEGTPRNPERALFWMKKAGDLDFFPAQSALSNMYATGDGVAKDPLQSMIWTLKLALKPTANSFWLNKAGDIFFEGWETIKPDYSQAIKFYERSANYGDTHALQRMAQIYLQGLGVTPDPQKAREYLDKSAQALSNRRTAP